MKKLVLVCLLLYQTIAFSQNRIVLQPQLAKDTISRHIYGHFAEHLGQCVYGGFYVGAENKEIPNRNGIRLDVVEALKKLNIPNLRWPGGCFADIYHWKDAIGPREKRKPIENVWWGGVREDNSFGTNEFLELCEMMGAEPYLAVNVGSGTVQEAADWVKYVNHPNGTSVMTDLRKEYGRTEPWNVKFWGVGNESWGCGGNMNVEHYANLYRQFATFMTSYSNEEKLFRIAVGPGTEDYHWTEVLMKEIPRQMLDGISVHHYSVINWNKKGSATNFSETDYFNTMQQAWRVQNMVEGHAKVMDKYDSVKKVALIVDEWGGWYDAEPNTNGAFLFQQNTMRDAMIAALTLNVFNNHCNRVKMANLAQCVNVLQAVILTEGKKLILTPTYHVMEMYKVHQDAVSIPLMVESTPYHLDGKNMQAVSASASRDKNGSVHISVANIDAGSAREITIDLDGVGGKTASARILHSKNIQDHNSFSNPDLIRPASFKDFEIKNNKLTIKLPPCSVVVIEIK
jgi:alpha-N-arabinofuranosidase